MNERFFADKAYFNKRLVQRLEQEMDVVPFDASRYDMTACRLHALLTLETTSEPARPKLRLVTVRANFVFVKTKGAHERVYLVDVERNTCTCSVWRKKRDCAHIKAVREHFHI